MDPSVELIIEVLSILKADTAVTSFVGNNIYERVPEKQDGTINVTSPYISINLPTINSDDFDCIDAVSMLFQINVYSWGVDEAYGSAECRKISHAVRKALNKKDIELNINGFVSINHTLTRFIRASDGVTNHGAVLFETMVDILD